MFDAVLAKSTSNQDALYLIYNIMRPVLPEHLYHCIEMNGVCSGPCHVVDKALAFTALIDVDAADATDQLRGMHYVCYHHLHGLAQKQYRSWENDEQKQDQKKIKEAFADCCKAFGL